MSENSRLMVESFLEKFQVDHPAVQGDAAREALRELYSRVAEASQGVARVATTMQIFTGMKARLTGDLDLIRGGGLPPAFIELLKRDPEVGLYNFLDNVYTNILEHVCEIGGVPYLHLAAPPPPPEPKKEDDLSADEQVLLKSSKCGLA